MNPRAFRYATRRGKLAGAIETAQIPVPLWLALLALLWAFGSCFQLITARHDLRKAQQALIKNGVK